MLLAGGLLLFVLIVGFVLKSCVDTQRRNGLRDYNDQVNRLGTESSENIAQVLQVLAGAEGADALQQSQQLSDLATDGKNFTQRARELDTPGGLEPATQNVATALSLRWTAVDRMADEIGKARGTSAAEQEAATDQIAGQLSAVLASDVLWRARVTPFIKDKFDEDDLNGESVTASVALTDQTWINPGSVANRIGSTASDDAAAEDPSKEIAPGTHGHQLSEVKINGTTLGDTVTNVSNPTGTSIVATIENQGENDEQNVTVAVQGVSVATGKSIFNQTKKVVSSVKGTSTPVTINVTKELVGSVKITAEVRKVGGEDNTSNNKKTYNVIFAK